MRYQCHCDVSKDLSQKSQSLQLSGQGVLWLNAAWWKKTRFISMLKCKFPGWFNQTKEFPWIFFSNLSFKCGLIHLILRLKRKNIQKALHFEVNLRYHWVKNQNLDYQNANDTNFFYPHHSSWHWFNRNRINDGLGEDSYLKRAPFDHWNECGWFIQKAGTYCWRSLCQFNCKIRFLPFQKSRQWNSLRLWSLWSENCRLLFR